MLGQGHSSPETHECQYKGVGGGTSRDKPGQAGNGRMHDMKEQSREEPREEDSALLSIIPSSEGWPRSGHPRDPGFPQARPQGLS